MIQLGCHGSTWELDYDKETDYLDRIIDTVRRTGFKGIDVQVALLGRYNNDPERLKDKLESSGVRLAALTVPFTWETAVESEEEKARADYYIAYVKHFPGALLNVPARNGPDRERLLERQTQIISCANALGERAYNEGVVASFHPASPATSYFRTAHDYGILFDNLDTRYIGYTPDAGHITAGGMDAFEVIRRRLPIIKHVHFKDCSSALEWKKMGQGDIDFPGIIRHLKDNGYNGWIMVEEETAEAAVDPDGVIADIGKHVQEHWLPIIGGAPS